MAHQNLIFIFLSSLVLISLASKTCAVEFVVSNEAVGTTGGTKFDTEIGAEYCRQTLEKATKFIWQIFGQSNEADRKNVQLISLLVKPMDVVADHTGDNIEVSADYINGFSGDIKTEITGIIYHELTHVWQWDGTPGPRAPQNLLEGIADYVRLKANLQGSYWTQRGSGNHWGERSDITAYFLDYCESLRPGFIKDLNTKMKTAYHGNCFIELLGKSADEVFASYKAKYHH
ncbi:hypothetical protein MKW94_002094 [Papaver nudicaule]|uniref:Plant basic secretory protein (BSP) family protein n=1 Tax=Papaver nudicaule TaxID=74823 RepID=A0AA41VZL8_PAPNU|nr:hypothetical protein [Papaver nudicaule]